VKVNVPVEISAPAAPAPQTAAGEPQKLGAGVYLLSGNYSVIAVEFKDHIALLESGQNDERAAEVIAAARKTIPGKPIRYVVNTHPHFDHAGGLRAFAAEGITILTHQTNKAYLEKALAQPRTLVAGGAVPARKPKVEGVGDKKVLSDGERTVELYRLQAFGHHEGMLVAYFPKEKVLFEADAYNPQPVSAAPPSPPSPYNLSLLENISALKLDVARIVPVHRPADDRVVTIEELRRWAGVS
jgi:glyoxylase-like metal-dependent hydrolase (beta-lactamase superfamily II)